MTLTRDAVLRLMKDRTAPICPTCLSKLIDTTFQRAFDAVMDIGLRRDYTIRVGACGECGEQHQVIWPREGRSPGGPSPDRGWDSR